MKYLSFLRRKLFLLIALLLFSGFVYSQSGAPYGGYYESVPNPYHPANQNAIENGWYEAIIQYSSNTGHRATYTLDVKVEQLCVVAILFPNGGSVHKGHNNSGYYYQGGGLYFERDRYGNVVAASTTVYIKYNDGDWQKFDIFIQ